MERADQSESDNNPASVSEPEDQSVSTGAPEAKAKRRSRNDTSDRVFKCGCGKTYLSYPALYTHVKQKHDGNPPEGSSAPNSRIGKPRGRPKGPSPRPGPDRPSVDEDGFYARFDWAGGPANPQEACSDTLELKEGLARVSATPTLIPESPCRDVLAMYFVEVAQKTKPESLKLFAEFLEALLVCLNEKGWSLPDEAHEGTENFCASRSARHVPEIANYFITDYLEGRKFATNRELAVEIMMHLCRWLYSQRFTKLKLSLIEPTNA